MLKAPWVYVWLTLSQKKKQANFVEHCQFNVKTGKRQNILGEIETFTSEQGVRSAFLKCLIENAQSCQNVISLRLTIYGDLDLSILKLVFMKHRTRCCKGV